MRIINKSIALVLVLIFLNSLLYAGWGGRKYDEYAAHISDKLYVLYIKHGICTDPKRDCRQKNIFFVSQAEPTLQFSLFLVDNLEMADSIIEIMIDEYGLAQKKGDKDLSIHLTICKESHQEIKNIGFLDSLFHEYAFIKLKLQGDKK